MMIPPYSKENNAKNSRGPGTGRERGRVPVLREGFDRVGCPKPRMTRRIAST